MKIPVDTHWKSTHVRLKDDGLNVFYRFAPFSDIPAGRRRTAQTCRLWGFRRRLPRCFCRQQENLISLSFSEWSRAQEVSDSLVRGKDVSYDRLAAGDDDALSHSQHSYRWHVTNTWTLPWQMLQILMIMYLSYTGAAPVPDRARTTLHMTMALAVFPAPRAFPMHTQAAAWTPRGNCKDQVGPG